MTKPNPIAIPDDDQPYVSEMAAALISTLEKGWPKDDTTTMESKVTALLAACASYLAPMPADSKLRSALLSGATDALSALTLANEAKELQAEYKRMGGS